MSLSDWAAVPALLGDAISACVGFFFSMVQYPGWIIISSSIVICVVVRLLIRPLIGGAIHSGVVRPATRSGSSSGKGGAK